MHYELWDEIKICIENKEWRKWFFENIDYGFFFNFDSSYILSLHSGHPIHFPLSIQLWWFIFSCAPKSDVSFWDVPPSPLILLLSWKQTFLCLLQWEWGGGRWRRRMMKAPLTLRTWFVFSPAHSCSTENSGRAYCVFSAFPFVRINSWET